MSHRQSGTGERLPNFLSVLRSSGTEAWYNTYAYSVLWEELGSRVVNFEASRFLPLLTRNESQRRLAAAGLLRAPDVQHGAVVRSARQHVPNSFYEPLPIKPAGLESVKGGGRGGARFFLRMILEDETLVRELAAARESLEKIIGHQLDWTTHPLGLNLAELDPKFGVSAAAHPRKLDDVAAGLPDVITIGAGDIRGFEPRAA